MSKILFYLAFFISICSLQVFANQAHLNKNAKQLMVVTTAHQGDIQGTLKRYSRHDASQAWQAIGNSMPVVVGQHGITASKKEGDMCTPMGIFELGSAFGFNAMSDFKMDYIPIEESTICVDDPKSYYYNQIINSKQIGFPDWQSKEEMQKISLYQYGIAIQNNNKNIPGFGSCVFMHIWRNNTSGTAGCVALEENNLKQLLLWLDKTQNPTIAILSNDTYEEIQQLWDLPSREEHHD
ncbi:MAG: L,D-transpeptidase [Candidatus Berkiella sp.]